MTHNECTNHAALASMLLLFSRKRGGHGTNSLCCATLRFEFALQNDVSDMATVVRRSQRRSQSSTGPLRRLNNGCGMGVRTLATEARCFRFRILSFRRRCRSSNLSCPSVTGI